MKDFWKAAFWLLCGLLIAGIIIIASSQPRGKAISLAPPPSPQPIQVHVSGAVVSPGLYHLPPNSRAGDAVQAAGGLLPDAYTQTLNLAAVVPDGARVFVPSQPTPAAPDQNDSTAPSRSISIDIGGSININMANQEELESLPGIGPALAERIIAYREANGPFSTIEEIQEVDGIGPKKFEDIKNLIIVEISP
jgi:competence protein ComEA